MNKIEPTQADRDLDAAVKFLMWQDNGSPCAHEIEVLQEAFAQRRLAFEQLMEQMAEALGPFAEAAMHLGPHPDDATTLDGIECRHWRQAQSTLAAYRASNGEV